MFSSANRNPRASRVTVWRHVGYKRFLPPVNGGEAVHMF